MRGDDRQRSRRAKARFHAYLLRCADGTLYSGYTRDLDAREARHNAGHGGRYTAGRLPVRIVYAELFRSQQAAMAREAAFKRMTKPAKEALLIGLRRRLVVARVKRADFPAPAE